MNSTQRMHASFTTHAHIHMQRRQCSEVQTYAIDRHQAEALSETRNSKMAMDHQSTNTQTERHHMLAASKHTAARSGACILRGKIEHQAAREAAIRQSK